VFLGLPEPKRVDLDVPAALGNTIAGDYNVGAFRFGVDTLGFVFASGRVALRLGGVESGAESLPLRYQGDATFVSAVDDEHLFVFEDGAAGATKLSMHYYEGVIDATKAGR